MEKTKNKGFWARLTAGIASFALALGVGVALANAEPMEARADSAEIVFKSAASDSNQDLGASPAVSDVVSSGAQYISSFSGCSKIYVGVSGIKIGASKSSGTLKFTLNSEYQNNVKSISIVSAKYGSDTGTLTLGSGSSTLKSGVTPGSSCIHEFSQPTTVETLSIATSSKRAYVTSIQITYEKPSAAVSVTGVTLNKSEMALSLNNSEKLVATVLPENATDKAVSWESDNTAVATVDNEGNVTGVAEGTANITVKTNDGDFSASCAVTVSRIAVTGVALDAEEATVNIGETITLNAAVSPANATNKAVTWESDNASVATVNNSGVVTGVAEGTANITVTTVDGEFTDSCVVASVVKKGTEANPYNVPEALAAVPATGNSDLVYTIGYIESIDELSVNYGNATFNICDSFGEGKSSLLVYRCKYLDNENFTSEDQIAVGDRVVVVGNLTLFKGTTPEYATGCYLVEHTPDTATALHFSNQKLSFKLGEAFSFGGTVTADMQFQGEKALTEADLTFDPALGTTFAKADLGNKEVSVTYAGHTEKYNITIGYADPTGVSLDEHSIKLSKNSDAIITATVANAATAEQVVEWSYDSTLTKDVDYLVDEDDNVVMISSKEVAGTITVTANVGEFSDSCVITITADPILTLDHDSFEGFSHDGQDYELHAHYENFADDVELFWDVNPTEGVIDLIDDGDNAMFTMVGAGTATITVTALDGEENELEASCAVTVTESQVNTLVLNETSKMVFGGEEFDLTATLTTQGAATKDVVWTSSNENVAIVVGGHVSTENVSGITTITATSGYAYGEKKSASCEVTVVASINKIGSEASASKTFSEMGYTNGQAIETIDLGNGIQAAFDKGSNNSNGPKYYTSGTAIRAYGGNTFTVTGNGLKEITISFGSGDGTNAITTDVGTYADGVWTGNANSVKFTIGGSSGNRRIAGISVEAEIAYANVNLLAQKAVLEFVDFMNAKMNEDGVCQANEKELHSGLEAAWTAVAEKYDALFGENSALNEADLAAAKAMFTNVDAKWCEAGQETVLNSLERAMKTYEYCVGLGCNAFMEGVRTVNPISNSIFGNANNGNSVMLGFLLVAVAGAAAAGGYLLLRRRKEDR